MGGTIIEKVTVFKWLTQIISIFCLFCIIVGCNNAEKNKERFSGNAKKLYFKDITDQVKIDFIHDPGVGGRYFMPESIGSGGAMLDYNNDGNLDIYLINGARGDTTLRNHLFRQEPGGTFIDVTESSGLGDTGYGMGVAVGDIDNDGDVDIYITNYGLDALYRNNGDETFTNISMAAGIRNPNWGCSVTFFDYNLDGFLDIYVTNYVAYNLSAVCMDKAGRRDYCGPEGFPAVPDILYHNNGNGTFTDVSVKSGIAKSSSKGLGVTSADFNWDFYPDIYVANDGEANHLWINQRDGTFKDQALMMGVALNGMGRPEAGMGVAVGDMDNDSDFDLFVTHLRSESNTFYRNAGEFNFQDDSHPAGLAGISFPFTGFGTGFFDYDNDGDLDLAVVNGRVTRGPLLGERDVPGYWDYYSEPNMLFENDGHGRFRDVGEEARTYTRYIENSRGLAFGDVDNDGDIDLLVMNEGGRARLFRNDVEKKGNWLIVRAYDSDLQRDAIGAIITVVRGVKRLHKLIAPGYSYLSSSDFRAHFGLGDEIAVDQIIVQWPGGVEEYFPGVKANQIITLKKGQTVSMK